MATKQSQDQQSDDETSPGVRPVKTRGQLLLPGAVIGVLVLLDYSVVSRLPRLCLWYKLTGTDCPLCGLTRSLIALGDFKLSLAFELHPFGPAAAAALLVWLGLLTTGLVTGKELAGLPRRLLTAAGALACLAWFLWWLIGVVGPQAADILPNLR